MFGYVRIDKPNMLIKDYAEYKAYYCGLCKTLGKRFSQLSRFTINYDITFLTLIAHNYTKTQPEFYLGHCVTHPVGKKFSILKNNPVQERIADINIILGYYKLVDDICDNGGVKYKAAKAYFNKKFKKSAKKMPALALSIKNNYEKLRSLEKAKEKSLDKLADCFATMLVDVGKEAAGKIDENLEELCYNLGRWIYIIDAYDDLDKDLKEGKFNPLASSGNITQEEKENIDKLTELNLVSAVKNIRNAYDKMEITISEGPLSNVIYCGLMDRTNAILDKGNKQCKKTLF